MSLIRMITILLQAYMGQLPDSCKNERENIIEIMRKQIMNKYKIDVTYENGNINILNCNDKIINEIEEYCKAQTRLINFEKNINDLIHNKEYKKALENIKNVNEDKILKDICEFYKAKILQEKGYYTEAIDKFGYCIKNDIKRTDALSSRSNCYNRIKKYDLAIKDLEILQETIGYNPKIYLNKGINLINSNKIEQAITEFNRSIEMNEYNPQAYYNRSVAYYKIKKYKEAERDIEKAMYYNPSNIFYKEQYEKFYTRKE